MPQPNHIRTFDQTSFSSWLYSLPIITRTWLLGSFTVTLLVGLGLLPLKSVVLVWPRVWQRLELWRLGFSVFLLGGLGLGFLFNILFILQYSKSVEEQVFFNDPADYLFMLMFCTAILWLWDGFVSKLFFFGPSLLSAVVYIWSKYHASQLVSIWGLIEIPGKYIPFAYLVMDLVTSGQLNVQALAGIVAGHCWYFADKIYPTLPGNQGRKLVTTPTFLRNWLPRRTTLSSGPIPPTTRPTSSSIRQHSWGPGRVLGE